MECYLTLFNIIQALFALAVAAGAGYLFYIDRTLISKIAMGIAAFYLLTAFFGFIGRLTKIGHSLWVILLSLLFLVQTAFFVGVVFFKDDVLGWVKEVDASGVTPTVDKAWVFVNKHILVAQIVLGVDAALILLAIIVSICCSGSRKSRVAFDSPV